MNLVIDRLDNLNIGNKSYEFIPEDIKVEMNLNGMIVGTEGEFLVNGKDVMIFLKESELRDLIGINMYNALIRKPMMFFLIPTQEDEFEAGKEKLDERYGVMEIHLNNFAQCFSLAFWFLKDSCVNATHIYWLNMFNGYNVQANRDMESTLSNGNIEERYFDDAEVQEAIARMYEIYGYLLPKESQMGKVEQRVNNGTIVWEIDKAISTEGKSFARALMKLQEARKTGVIPSKIDKYCSILECLYAININHKRNISKITAAYIGRDSVEKEEIIANMKAAYGVRSDYSHGDSLKFFKESNVEDLVQLSCVLDDYVRRVFRKILETPELNYDIASESKAKVRRYFKVL